jgi:hypothetical protein
MVPTEMYFMRFITGIADEASYFRSQKTQLVTYIPGYGMGLLARTRSLCVSWSSWMTVQTGGISSHCSIRK